MLVRALMPRKPRHLFGRNRRLGTVVDNDSDDDGACDADEVAGCQDVSACNFNTAATDDDSSRVYATGCETCPGETDGTGTIVDNDSDDDEVATLMRSLVAKTRQLVITMLYRPITTVAVFMRRVAKHAQVKQMVRVP